MSVLRKTAAIWALMVLFVPVQGHTATIELKPGADLQAAISQAAPGTVIELAGGKYGGLNLSNLAGSDGQPVIIRSASPRDPAQISSMDLRNVGNLVFQKIVFDYIRSDGDRGNLRPFQVFDARNLTFEGNLFDGDLSADTGKLGSRSPTAYGLAIRGGENIVVKGNEVRTFFRGFILGGIKNLQVTGNDLHGLRMDGMNFIRINGGLIEGNYIHDFRRVLGAGDHADMIQFWTNKTDVPSVNIVLRGNILNSGLGPHTQSIFMRNEEVDKGRAGSNMFYRNITIEDNVIINAHLHGITLGETDGVVIRNNTVIHNRLSDGEKKNPGLWRPQIRVAKASRNVLLENNAAAKITPPSGKDWVVAGNVVIQDETPRRANYYKSLFAVPFPEDPTDLTSFRYTAESLLRKQGAGSSLLGDPVKTPLPDFERLDFPMAADAAADAQK